jgi:Zn-dependent protease with chaperone function
MRIPFDLFAAALVLFAVGELTTNRTQPWVDSSHMLCVWSGFWLITWLLNEWVTRRTEWRTRFGRQMDAPVGKRHPLEIHSFEVLAAQAVTVALFGLALWALKWPMLINRWPHWVGLGNAGPLGHLELSDSRTVKMALGLAPFMIAMVISWIPRWRFFSTSRRRKFSLLKYLDFEARLTWLPIIPGVILSLVSDIGDALPLQYTAWTDEPGMSLSIFLLTLGLAAAVGLPVFMTHYWQCSPLPDGELKDRLLRLLDKSGVKVRKIMVWGTRDSGMLNACVIGPWSRFRYVLISPALVDELGMDETEAVLAHELGHARHGHLTLLFITLFCFSTLADPLARLLPPTWQKSPAILASALFVFMIVYIRGFFGAIMRECEREADLASAELVGSPIPIVAALEKLALRSGNTRNIYTWHHGSIADRVASVLKLSGDPIGSARVHAQIRRVRFLFVVLAVLAIGWQAMQHDRPDHGVKGSETAASKALEF